MPIKVLVAKDIYCYHHQPPLCSFAMIHNMYASYAFLHPFTCHMKDLGFTVWKELLRALALSISETPIKNAYSDSLIYVMLT